MNHSFYSFVTGSIFLLVAVLHALRLVFQWHVTVQGWGVPIGLSWVAVFISAFLAYEGLRLCRHL